MPGYNHFADCLCGWCVNYGRRRQAPRLNHDVAYARAALERYGVKTDNFASCFVRPNASCPVCGAKVFFYANDRGSRVYFDHLGRPWPKHGCTDGRKGFGYWPPRGDHPPMSRRSKGEIDDIIDNLAEVGDEDVRSRTQARFNSPPQTVLVVEDCVRSGFQCWVIARELVGATGDRFGFAFDAAKFEPMAGDLFAYDGERISFFSDSDKPSKPYRASVQGASAVEAEIARRRREGGQRT